MSRDSSRQAALNRQASIARARLIMMALGFVDLTLSEMDQLDGTTSASAPAEFMLLHEAAQTYREAVRAAENERENGHSRAKA